MATKLVAIWSACSPDNNYPVYDTSPWDDLDSDTKFSEVESAIRTAGEYYQAHYARDASAPNWIFVGTEYALGTVKIAQRDFVTKMVRIKGLSGGNGAPLIVPGTGMMIQQGKSSVLNFTGAFHDGESKCQLGKSGDVGEPVGEDGTFKSGDGKASFEIGGNTYGLQICQDATGTCQFLDDVDVQIVVGRGVGIANPSGGALEVLGIREQAKKFILVGDTYKPAVRYTGVPRRDGVRNTHENRFLAPVGNVILGRSSMQYFEIDV